MKPHVEVDSSQAFDVAYRMVLIKAGQNKQSIQIQGNYE